LGTANFPLSASIVPRVLVIEWVPDDSCHGPQLSGAVEDRPFHSSLAGLLHPPQVAVIFVATIFIKEGQD
jgi:hypothetical protein